MITGNFLELVTDREEQRKVVELYNSWSSVNMFSSPYPCQRPEWEELKEFCIGSPELTKELFLEMYSAFNGEVGFFTHVLHFVFPGTVEVIEGYIPIDALTRIWWKKLSQYDED